MNEQIIKKVHELEMKQMYLGGQMNALSNEIQQLKNSCMYAPPPNNYFGNVNPGHMYHSAGSVYDYLHGSSHSNQGVPLDELSKIHTFLFNGLLTYFQRMISNGVFTDTNCISFKAAECFIEDVKRSGNINTSLNTSNLTLGEMMLKCIDNVISVTQDEIVLSVLEDIKSKLMQ